MTDLWKKVLFYRKSMIEKTDGRVGIKIRIKYHIGIRN